MCSGSVFWIELPLNRPASGALVSSEFSTDRAAKYSSSKTLLYIEDNLSNLRLVEQIMRHRPQVKMLAAEQGQIGLELALEHLPDLILLDLQLPDMLGGEVLTRLRGDPRTAHIPVIMISAVVMGAELDHLARLGACAYVTKPFDVRGLLGVLDDAFLGRCLSN
ncbi:MAG: response regulator [Chthoniobacterales bacterium]